MHESGTATITFADNSTLSSDYNGDCFITDEKPDFPDDLSVIEIDRIGEEEETLYNAELMECASADGRYWFSFREPSPEERRQKELEDTIQMLTDCLLEMSELIYS